LATLLTGATPEVLGAGEPLLIKDKVFKLERTRLSIENVDDEAL
jgi:hypothetical protein